ncbi:PxKF domain-containing protein [Lentzea flava]|uniref:CBM6 domain-containing protein n=1 Tax=Lentzea flava TaxID=103732 RepID=A0ABQ2ULJ1_9PSEU|nr:PxKF domain-containing protein [Lentzea flava]MCP2200574.1 Carbohydrate binding module (family 6) [Lentzea flava]GGU43642.1 hypothetical protein GCM10010178_40230 [Lentzea flava]
MAAHDNAEGGAWSGELNRRRFLGGAVLGAGLAVAAQLPLVRQAVAHEVPVRLNPAALRPDARVRALIAALTLDEKVGLLHQFSAAVIRLGIPQFRTGTDCLHGVSWLGYATVFPQNTGLAEVGLQLNRIRNGDWAVYRKIDFRGVTRADLILNHVKVSTEPAKITIRADDPVSGPVLGSVTVTGDHDLNSAADYRNPLYHWRWTTVPITTLPGVYDLYFVFDISPAIPDTDISNAYGAVAGWLDLGINWFRIGYRFDGFRAPVAIPPAVNRVKAGSAVPIRFGLGGDAGGDVIAPGSPARNQGDLRYDLGRDEYSYIWKTDRSWAGSSREFTLTLTDRTTRTARFAFS